MSGIQISGLLSNSAFDWKSVVDQLVAASGIPLKKLEANKDGNTAKIEALTNLNTALAELKDAVQVIRSDEVFSMRTVSSDAENTTWKSSSVTGAPMGSYTFDVTQLATQSLWRGASDIGSSLAPTSDVSGVTLANLATGTAVTAGIFTVAGKQITVELTDSLQDVFTAIDTATGGVVQASYNSTTDKISLVQASGELVLGAGNDTSNFLTVTCLANSGTGTATSSTALGTVKTTAPLASAGLRTAITAVDGTGAGSFTINGVTVAYNVNADTLKSVLERINESDAGVTASYESTYDRVVLQNKETGDVGIAVDEAAGGLLGALGLSVVSGGAFVHGKNAKFSVNDGEVLTSSSNTLEAAAHGIAGLSVTVNTGTKQTLQVESDTISMQGAIEKFIEKFNAVQDFIDENTAVAVSGTSVETAVLSGNREIQEWARKLRAIAFDEVSGVAGDIKRLNHLGIDFEGTTSRLKIKDSGRLATALGDKPEEVESLFLTPTTGLVGRFYTYLAKYGSAGRSQTSNLVDANADLDDQIATLQARLDAEREQLTNSFMRMLDAQSTAQSQNTYLTNTFFKNNSN